MQQIGASIFAEDRFSLPPGYRGSNPSFVVTSSGVVMIDTPMFPTDAVKWRDFIQQKGEVRFIINTHSHPDHIAGNYFFPGVIIAHDLAKLAYPQLEHVRLSLKERDPEGINLIDERFYLKPPDITFSERLTLHCGEHIIGLYYLPGHTAHHIGVYLPREKVFFSGDNFTSRVQPSLANCLPLDWLKSLRKIESLDIDTIVPGHGKICSKVELREFIQFLEQCIEMVRTALRQGMSSEEAASRISFEGLCPAVHPGPEMQRKNVLRLYEMLSRSG